MRWIRFVKTLVAARYRSSLTINEESKIRFSVWPTDIDVSIMNHAAIMSVMETGRIDFMVRTGFLKLARKHKWYFPSSCISVQFFKPLKIFETAVLTTRVFNVDSHWIFIEQTIIRNGKAVAACIVKSTVKKGRETINVLEVIKELQIGDPPSEGHELVEAFEKEHNLMQDRFSGNSFNGISE